MSTKCVIAIVPSELLGELERKLVAVHAPGLTVTRVRGTASTRISLPAI